MRPNEGSNARTALEGRGALSGDQRQKRRMYKACHAYYSVYMMCLLLIQRRMYTCVSKAPMRMQIRHKTEMSGRQPPAEVGRGRLAGG